MIDSTADTKFAYDGPNTLAEYDGSNALQKRYVSGPGIDEPIVSYDASGSRSFLGSDEHGSVISLTDSSGTLIALNRYDEYGRPQGTNIGRFQYTGQRWIGEAGLYDYKARAYLPHLGIFAQTDPVGYDAGANLNAYVLNDPVNLADPLGLQGCIVMCPPDDGGIIVEGKRLHLPAPELPNSSALLGGTSASNGLPGSSDGGAAGEIVVIAQRIHRSTLPAKAGSPYLGETPKQQMENCQTNPLTRRALNDPRFLQARKEAIDYTLSRSSDWEYGFWTYVPRTGPIRVWDVDTSRDVWEIDAWALSPYFLDIFRFSLDKPNVFDHTHIPDVPLSQEDVNFAKENGVSVIASTDEGNNYCYPR